MFDAFIVYIFMEVLGPWIGGAVTIFIIIMLVGLAGMASSLGGCTKRLVAA